MTEFPEARRRVNPQPAWATRPADAQARASARRLAHSDATITTWVRALMRELPRRAERGGDVRRPG
jgi:hypothetical protein